MPIDDEEGTLENITEIYGIGQNAVEVQTKNGQRFRVYAARVIRGPNIEFTAIYERQITIKVDGQNEEVDMFVEDCHIANQNGETIEDCLSLALGWVDEIGGNN